MRARQDGTYCGMMCRAGRLLRTKRHWQSLLLAGVLVCLLLMTGCSDLGKTENRELQAKPPKIGDVLHDPLSGMEFVWIPKGCFKMGWVAGKIGHWNQEPAHKVCFDEGFWMGRYEVTQEQWQRVMGENPSYFNEERIVRYTEEELEKRETNRGAAEFIQELNEITGAQDHVPVENPPYFNEERRDRDTRKHPVENVSWYDVQEFLQKLNEQVGTDDRYQLPSEAQWEYAARAGTKTLYFFGDHSKQLQEYAWYRNLFGIDGTRPVGLLKPNPWGLYDIYGNVKEWCADPWHKDYIGAPTDGSVWEEGGDPSLRIQRGGTWNDIAYLAYSAVRDSIEAKDRYRSYGFRIMIPSSKIVVSLNQQSEQTNSK